MGEKAAHTSSERIAKQIRDEFLQKIGEHYSCRTSWMSQPYLANGGNPEMVAAALKRYFPDIDIRVTLSLDKTMRGDERLEIIAVLNVKLVTIIKEPDN